MTYSDKEKLKRLCDTFDINYRVTSLYSEYLERFPELITKEMVDTLTEDGTVTREDAIVALLSEVFMLDDARGGAERRIIRDYLRKSVKILDTGRYYTNPYYQNIPIKNIKDGDWEYRTETYPPYRAMICDDIKIFPDRTEIPMLGFFPEEFRFPAVLEGGNEWMTLSPVDVDTSEAAIERAHGKVVTFGLGLGYYAYMVSRKENVESITVVEKSEKVIALFKKYILPYFEHPEKVKTVCSDAFLYAEKVMPSEGFDLAFVDTWRDAGDGAPMYKKMKALERYSPSCEFMYWIENFLISRLTALKFEELYSAVTDGAQDAPQSYTEFIERLDSLVN